MGHPAFQSSLPRWSSSVGPSVKGDRCGPDGWREAGRRTTTDVAFSSIRGGRVRRHMALAPTPAPSATRCRRPEPARSPAAPRCRLGRPAPGGTRRAARRIALGARQCARPGQPVARRENRPEQEGLAELGAVDRLGGHAELLCERHRQRVVGVERWPGLAIAARMAPRRAATPRRPRCDDPARLELEQGEVGALGEELADDARAGEVRGKVRW